MQPIISTTGNRFRTICEIVGAVLLVLALVGFSIYRTKAKQAQYDLSVLQSNERANADSLRQFHTKFDSMQTVVGRLIVQADIREKELTGALGDVTRRLDLVTKSVQTLHVEIKGVEVAITSDTGGKVVHDPQGAPTARALAFTLHGPPVDGALAVIAPFDTTKPGTLDAKLTPTPFDMRASVSCDTNKDARVLVETPPWVHVGVTMGQVDPTVCHGERPTVSGGLFHTVKTTGWVGLGILTGYLIKSVF